MNLAIDAYHIKPQTFPWPPVHFAMAFIAAFILRQTVPMTISVGLTSTTTGVGLIAASLALEIWAVLTLRAGDTAILPNRAARHLVTRGPFRLTRNPIYLGYIMTLAGFGMLVGDAWFFIAAIAAVLAMTLISIRREEMHLLARFGADFERYSRRTPRWI